MFQLIYGIASLNRNKSVFRIQSNINDRTFCENS